MKRTIQLLCVVLFIQLILMVLTTATHKQDLGAYASNEKLLDIDLSTIDQIKIEQPEKSALKLTKKGNNWTIANLGNFPVAQFQWDSSIKKLLSVNKSWPVAITESSSKHFRVADDSFERKMVFSQDDKVVKTIILGKSPGFKKIHARVADANEIYQIKYGVFDANTDPNAWTDKNYLKLSEGSIKKISLPDSLVLQKQDKQFVVSGLTETEESNPDPIKKVISHLADVKFTSVLGTENKPEFHQDQPQLKYSVVLDNGGTISYTYSKQGDSEDLVLKTSAHPYYFKILPATIKNIIEAKRSTLVKNKELPVEQSATETDQQMPENNEEKTGNTKK